MRAKKRTTKKKRGRPATGQDPVTAIRLSTEMLETVEEWRRHLYPKSSRSEFIRWLIDEAIVSLGRKEKARRRESMRAAETLAATLPEAGAPFTAEHEATLTTIIKRRHLSKVPAICRGRSIWTSATRTSAAR